MTKYQEYKLKAETLDKLISDIARESCKVNTIHSDVIPYIIRMDKRGIVNHEDNSSRSALVTLTVKPTTTTTRG